MPQSRILTIKGSADIYQKVVTLQGSEEPAFQVFTGRGHIMHVDDHIQYINSHTNLIVLGACGGYGFQHAALQKSPNAQFIGSQGGGNTEINDYTGYLMSNSINKNAEIVWPKEQAALDKINSPDARDLLLPHKDKLLMMSRRANHLQGLSQDNVELALNMHTHAPITPHVTPSGEYPPACAQ